MLATKLNLTMIAVFRALVAHKPQGPQFCTSTAACSQLGADALVQRHKALHVGACRDHTTTQVSGTEASKRASWITPV